MFCSMKEKNYLFFLFVLIILFSTLTSWRFKDFKEAIQKTSLPNFEIKMPDLKISSESKENAEKKEFVSQDKKLKFVYSSDWLALENLEAFNQELLKEGAEILLFAQKFDLEKSFFAFLIAQKMNLAEEKAIPEIIELFQEKTKEKGLEMEIVKMATTDSQASIDLQYKKNEEIIFLAKEKIIIDGTSVYLIDVASPEKDWTALEKEAEEIIGSIQFSE